MLSIWKRYLQKVWTWGKCMLSIWKGIFKTFGLGENVCYLFGMVSSKHNGLDWGECYSFTKIFAKNELRLVGIKCCLGKVSPKKSLDLGYLQKRYINIC